MTIFERYFFRDLLVNLAAVVSVLTLMTAGRLLITLTGKVAGGSYPPDIVLPLLLLGTLDWVVQTLPFSAMLASVLVLGRYYRDNEIYAAFSIRVGYRRIFATLMRLGAPLALLALYLVMNVLPTAHQQFRFIKESGKQRVDVGAVGAGRFMEMDGGVLFIERRDGNAVEGVFVAARRDGKWTVETAARGEQRGPEGGRKWLELHDGRFYERARGRDGLVVSSYRRHSVLLPEQATAWRMDKPDMMSVAALWASPLPAHRAELQWRLSIPVSLLLLLMVSEPLSRTAPRRGRSLPLAASIVFFLVYSNILALVTGMIASGRLPAAPGVWPVHLTVLALALVLMRRRVGRARAAASAPPAPTGEAA